MIYILNIYIYIYIYIYTHTTDNGSYVRHDPYPAAIIVLPSTDESERGALRRKCSIA